MLSSGSRIFAGIDPSLRSTGLVIIGSGILDISKITPKNIDGVKRLQYIRDAVNIKTKDCEAVCVEGPSLYSVNRADDIGQLRGVLLVTLADMGIPTIVIPPTSLKKFATGRGDASKEQMIEAAKLKTGGEISGDDEADAFWLALLAQGLHAPTSDLTRYQLDTIRGIRMPKVKSKVSYARNLNI